MLANPPDSDDIFDDLNAFLEEATKATRLRAEQAALTAKLRSRTGSKLPNSKRAEIHQQIASLNVAIEVERWEVTGVAIFWRRSTCRTCAHITVQFESFGQHQQTRNPPLVQRTVRIPDQSPPAVAELTEQVFHDHYPQVCTNCYHPAASLPTKSIKERT